MIYFLGINIVSLIIYGIDKFQAIRKKERISENILLILTGMGGCIGALTGMVLFRHKIKKTKFQITVLLSMIIWIIMIYKGVVQ